MPQSFLRLDLGRYRVVERWEPIEQSRMEISGTPTEIGQGVVRDHHSSPPPEISEAGDDRCLIAIRPERLSEWLAPDPENLEAMDAILGDPERLRYEHGPAA